MGLLDDQIRFAPGLRLHVLSCTLGRDERRTEKLLELAMLGSLGLKFLHATGELGAPAPDSVEAFGDFLQKLVDVPAPIPAEPRSAEIDVCDFVWCDRHATSLRESHDETV